MAGAAGAQITNPSVAGLPATQASPQITESKVGPWGQLQLVPIVLELPEEFATAERAMVIRDRWNFAAMDREQALAFLAACAMTPSQLASMRAAKWKDASTRPDAAIVSASASVEPPDAVVLSLSPEVRANVYSKLMIDPANKSAIDPSWFREGRVDFRLRGSELSDTSIALLKRLLYAGADGTLLFNDIKPALRAIPDAAERMRFLMAVTRKRSLMARLTITPESDTAALAEYWGRGERTKDVLPLLNAIRFNAMSGVENPSRLNIASLLPPFVQKRLYRHADTTDVAGREPDDCYWTAFNFFSDVPDDRVHEMSYLAELLRRDYVKIDAPSQLGDVILLADAMGDVLHAANYIADDIVFTKNGMSDRQPWILVPMKDILTQYGIRNEGLTIGYYRKR